MSIGVQKDILDEIIMFHFPEEPHCFCSEVF